MLSEFSNHTPNFNSSEKNYITELINGGPYKSRGRGGVGFFLEKKFAGNVCSGPKSALVSRKNVPPTFFEKKFRTPSPTALLSGFPLFNIFTFLTYNDIFFRWSSEHALKS